MNLRNQTKDEPEINITSLIDIVFLLLIFFMVSTTFDRQSTLEITLPEASANVIEQQETVPVELIIDAGGRMFLGNNALIDSRRETLSAALESAYGDKLDQAITLRADAQTPHHYVVLAMDVMAQLGFVNLSIATTPIDTAE